MATDQLTDAELAVIRARLEASTDGALSVSMGYLAKPATKKIIVEDLNRRGVCDGYAVATFGPASNPDSMLDAEMFAHARIDGLALLDNLVDARTALSTLKADLRLSRVSTSDRNAHACNCAAVMEEFSLARWEHCTCDVSKRIAAAAAARIDAALKEGERCESKSST